MRHFVLGRANGTHIQFFRYFFVGGSSAVIDLILYSLLVTYFDMHYLIAAVIAYAVGLAWNHTIVLLWVFESKHHRAKEVLMVIGIAIGGLIWTELLLYLQVDFLYFDEIVAKIIALWIVLIWNFVMRKFFVFK